MKQKYTLQQLRGNTVIKQMTYGMETYNNNNNNITIYDVDRKLIYFDMVLNRKFNDHLDNL